MKAANDKHIVASRRMKNSPTDSNRIVVIGEKPPAIGEIIWFGGFNNVTGHDNNYGFISTKQGDVYLNREHLLSPPESLQPGVKVIFRPITQIEGKLAATSVRTLSSLTEDEIAYQINESTGFSPEEILTLILYKNKMTPCEERVLSAISSVSPGKESSDILRQFWRKFPPVGLQDPFFQYVPENAKEYIYKKYFLKLTNRINNFFSKVEQAKTSLNTMEIYSELNEHDEKIALHWAGPSKYDGVLAQMLSARAAEKAVKKCYERVGLHVEDISIKQLEGGGGDWTTHDLLLDSNIAIDVKNARRPVNGENFFVEHTVPKYKLDRKNEHVRIAGMLSPYLQLQLIRKPSEAKFRIDDLIFLGETSRKKIDQLISIFNSPTFEVTRFNERMVPHWLFSYPEAWYKDHLVNKLELINDFEWPDDDGWKYLIDSESKLANIAVFCALGKQLPSVISAELAPWQLDFYNRVQDLIRDEISLSAIFLAVLTDFLEKLKDDPPDFSPENYSQILFFVNKYHSIESSYPLGAIDPLGLVHELIQTLTTLWDHRDQAKLKDLHNFRFIGWGILQGRERDQGQWKTIIAYCGGTAYKADDDGNVILSPTGKPAATKGKCGRFPLIIGKMANCTTCGKLICDKCGFCCLPCQDRKFSEMTQKAAKNTKQVEERRGVSHIPNNIEPPQWEEIPFEAYKDDFNRGRW